MRIETMNDAPLRSDASFVLYWMTAQRRTRFNFALERAVSLANELGKPLLVLEALRVDYAWATARTHRFVLDGMRDNRAACTKAGASYHGYVEPRPGEGRGLLEALGEHACAVVTDTYPCFFLRGLPEKVAGRLSVRLESVDGCGLLPLKANDRVFTTAHSFRRHMQKNIAAHLEQLPCEAPLATLKVKRTDALPRDIESRWPAASKQLLSSKGDLGDLPIDHSVARVALEGGPVAGAARLDAFMETLSRYPERNHPDKNATSGLSPYLHFGHVSVFDIFLAVAEREDWTPDQLPPKASGSREGWWGMSGEAEGFLDQVITWRELGFNMCFHRDDYDAYESLPEWSRRSLEEHLIDDREYIYSLEELDAATTHDTLWNAAQTQLKREGIMHNYLRMLWGKKILQWSPTPKHALEHMIELNNRYALDGRDPNSYSGIFWVLGRYDRAWGPERPIFGKIRYMTSDSAQRKLRLREYVKRYAPATA